MFVRVCVCVWVGVASGGSRPLRMQSREEGEELEPRRGVSSARRVRLVPPHGREVRW